MTQCRSGTCNNTTEMTQCRSGTCNNTTEMTQCISVTYLFMYYLSVKLVNLSFGR